MTTRAQLAQERSRQRREAMLKAAVELFAEGGSRAVTHRAVAKRAGLPPATTTYYFESIEDLLREALLSHMQTWNARFGWTSEDDTDAASEAVEDFAPAGSSTATVNAEQAITLIAARFGDGWTDDSGLELSIYLAATRDSELLEPARESARELEASMVKFLTAMGLPDPDDLALSITCLLAGVAMSTQCMTSAERRESGLLRNGLRALFAAHLMGRDHVDAVLSGS